MSEVKFNGVQIRGVAAAVPEQLRTLEDDMTSFGREEVLKISASTGVVQRHYSHTLCTSDLCFAAAERLFEQGAFDKSEIDAVIFVSQTPDYDLPATACILQDRLGLSQECVAYDINLGCSGYVYGLWTLYGLIAGGAIKKALLLVGDMSYFGCSPEDRSVALLFGDAGTATIIEGTSEDTPSFFVLGTDGGGKDHLLVKAGRCRYPLKPGHDPKLLERVLCEGGNMRSPAELYMNGAEIFTFTLKSVPPLMKKVLAGAQKEIDDIDYFVFHQANKFMLEHLRKRVKIPPEKFMLALENYGNTSSASIPLAMVTHMRDRLTTGKSDLVLAGFGVGFSWSAVNLQLNKIVIPDLVKVPEL